MSRLFRNDSPNALTREQAVALEKTRRKQRAAQAQDLAAQGRGGDTEIAHVTLGELVIPRILQTSELVEALRRAAAANNIPFDALRIGSRQNRINPNTGVPEFDYYTDYDRESFFVPNFDDLPGLNNLPDISNLLDPGEIAWNSTPSVDNGSNIEGITTTAVGDSEDDQAPYVVQGPPTEGITVTTTEDPETLRRAHVIYGETSSIYPQRANAGSIFNPNSWDPESAAALAGARAKIGVVSSRNKVTKSASPDMSKGPDRLQWDLALQAARASHALDESLDPAVKSYYMWQKGSSQDSRLPSYNPLQTSGPFYTSGGGRPMADGTLEVPSGNNLYLDFYNWLKK